MAFINDNFMLQSDTARALYHSHAAKMPIIDYHCHLVPQQIAENIQFRDITQLWLVDGHYGDHYKWRAMRANGVSEDYLTGGTKSAWETFEKWAETVPYTMRNPLYHWTHLELSRVFGIDKLLSPKTAREIFEQCNALLATPGFRGQALIRRFNVEVVCTTDDPADDLRWHKMIAAHPFGTKVIPAWRPDKAMAIENPKAYKAYLQQLGEAAGLEIDSYADLQEALQKRHDFFAANGCKLSDHGLENFYAADYKEIEIELIFKKVLMGFAPNAQELEKFRSAFLYDQAVMDADPVAAADPIPFAAEANAAWRTAQGDNQTLLHRIRTLAGLTRSPTAIELLELQYDVANLAFQQEVITKVADKTSTAVQTLIKNQ